MLSLFPGIGLLDRAFELEGFTVVRGPDAIWGGDIRMFHPPAGVFAGVIGGPPCQTFSQLANLVRAQGHEPKFGNLIPEFERCVAEAAPAWFVMENVPGAPVPVVAGYGVHTQRLNNRWLGEEQHRLRAWSFGTRGETVRLMIETLALELALRHVTVLTGGMSRGVSPTVTNNHGRTIPRSAGQLAGPTPTVTSNVGGKGKGGNGNAHRDRSAPSETVTSKLGPHARERVGPMGTVLSDGRPGRRERNTVPGTVTSSDGGASKKMWRYTLAEALELQGLPADFLTHAPFTAAGKLGAVANGVPIPMGRAIARAVKRAIGQAVPL